MFVVGESFHSPEQSAEIMNSEENWQKVQQLIWVCDKCESNSRIECHLRQQTAPPCFRPVRLLVIGVAPPFRQGQITKSVASSATNDPRDNLRIFVEQSLGKSWPDLLDRGFFFLHSVKCAIVPDDAGFQNPPHKVVDLCASAHLSAEIHILHPAIILALGGTARRAVTRYLGSNKPKGLRVSGPLEGDFLIDVEGQKIQVIVTRFIRGRGKTVAKIALRRAAGLAGLLD